MSQPSVYIVILNWNGLGDTIECLRSIEKLAYSAIATIVVDNGSRNREAEQIEEKFPHISVIRQSKNIGFCAGCNLGIDYAIEHGADYVMLLNNDTLVPPDLIDKLLDGVGHLDGLAAVSPVIFEHPDTQKIWYSDARWIAANAKFQLSKPGEKYSDISTKKPYKTHFACGCCMLIPTPVLKDVGILDERYFAFYDEAAWCAAAARKGLRSYVVPSAYMYHKVSRSTPALVSTYLLTRNRLLWMKENLPLSERIKSVSYLAKEFVWHTANVAGVAKKHYSRQHSKLFLQAYFDYFRGKFFKWSDAAERKMLADSK